MYVFSAQALARSLVLHKPLHTAYTALCRKAAMSPIDLLRKCDPTRELPSDLQACLGNTVVAFGTYT